MIPKSAHPTIVKRIKNETLQAVASDYGVTRERIRQIGREGGFVRTAERREQRNILYGSYAEEVLYYREAWMEIKWQNLPINNETFQSWLRQDAPQDIRDRWEAAKGNHRSRKGGACIEGRVCVSCHIWKPWGEFHKSRNMPNDHSHRCKACACKEVMHYHRLRNVEEPTVTEKGCPRCGETKPASAFARSTHNNSGLQTYCRPCHNSFPSQLRKRDKP